MLISTDQNIPSSFYSDLINQFQKFKLFFIVGNLNAHHYEWGCYQHQFQMPSFSKISRIPLIILNKTSCTLVHPLSHSTINIDLVITSPLLFSLTLCKTRVETDTYGSDHRPIITEFQFSPQYSLKFCYKPHDLDNLYLYLKSNASDVLSFTDVSQ